MIPRSLGTHVAILFATIGGFTFPTATIAQQRSQGLSASVGVTQPAVPGRVGLNPLLPVNHQPVEQLLQPSTAPIRVAENAGLPGAGRPRFDTSLQHPDEHPLMPALRWAYAGIEEIRGLEDYSCNFVKHERVGGDLLDHEHMFMKVRHRPFSVYMYFLSPPAVRGQEVIFVEGQNDGKMWAHTIGVRDRLVGTVSLSPTGPLAMKGNRYPITEAGILTLVTRLIEIGERDAKFGECDVQFFPDAKVNGRRCTCIQVVHPVPRRNFLFHLARIYVDDELNMPIRYEAFDWPEKQGGKPVLTEEYTYLNFKANNGFTDADFDIRNPSYNFR